MDFVCAKCGHRQAADTTCGACHRDVVHDLREPETLQYLRAVEERLDRARSHKIRAIGAAIFKRPVHFTPPIRPLLRAHDVVRSAERNQCIGWMVTGALKPATSYLLCRSLQR